MQNELPWFLPAVLGLAVGILVWALLSARDRSKKNRDKRPS
jgi:hypothetical protein